MRSPHAPRAGLDDAVLAGPLLPDVLHEAVDFYAQRVAGWGRNGFVRFAGQARSCSAREVFVRAASGGRFTMADLARWVQVRDEHAVAEVARCDWRVMTALAALIANQRLRTQDVADAATLYALVVSAHGEGVLNRRDRLLLLEVLSELKDRDRFNAVFAAARMGSGDWAQAVLLEANLHNPWDAGLTGADPARWHGLVNSIYRAAGMEEIEVLDRPGPPLDRVLCSPASIVDGGPLVTVMVPTRNPTQQLGTALSSILCQSWANLEVLILDDGSAGGSVHRILRWAESDERVRVLHTGTNIGNYAARNIGMREATGELITVHDDDDWSHPRKIELQARHLLANEQCLANMSQMVRTTSDLQFLRINSNPVWIQPNYSSLMYKRQAVMELVGVWDEVAKAADAEYRNRLTAVTNQPPPAVGGAPMSLMRARSGSLTHGEIQRAHLDPRRQWYDLSSRSWHRRTLERGKVPRLEPSEGPRAFSVPVGLQATRPDVIELDVVYATDYRFPGGNTSASVSEIRSLLQMGLRVGLLQMESPVLVSTTDIHERVLDTALSDGCTVVSRNDRVDADVLIVRHPTVLQFAEPRRAALTARHHVLIVNHAPAFRDGTEAHYEINECVSNFAAVFGSTPLVAPESGVIRDCLRPRLRSPMTSFDWTGTIDSVATHPRNVDETRAPVWGRHSRDNREKWPAEPETIQAVYPFQGADVRILGGAQIPQERVGLPPSGWTVYPFGSKAPADFLAELDFWVYFHQENLIESFGMATIEAMAAGLVVILPEYMRSTFGEGAVYCAPAEVSTVIEDLWASPAGYREQSARALEVAERQFASQCFQQRIRGLTA